MQKLNKKFDWQCCDISLPLGKRTFIMGILNVTPDSFSDGGQYANIHRAVDRALEMAEQGADIIDVGGESTRPGAEKVSEADELNRVVPVIEALSEQLNIPISVDTYKSHVAERALEAGAKIVNDISGLRFDKRMAKVVAAKGAGVVLMHIKGEPRNMQQNPHYDDVMNEIVQYLDESKKIAFKEGISNRQIVIDPGIGFGKRLQDNFTIIRELDKLFVLSNPILVGPSRKSFIGNVLELPANERLEGTAAAVALSIQNGAQIVRVHDVKEIKRVVKITDAILKNDKRWD
ncbi:MAG: dihydropteroate synthase [Calditrichaeota bacterium]|nr:dihydropteroate synthase [Calditrichota bacterium]